MQNSDPDYIAFMLFAEPELRLAGSGCLITGMSLAAGLLAVLKYAGRTWSQTRQSFLRIGTALGPGFTRNFCIFGLLVSRTMSEILLQTEL